jgi:C4-dicarboxylate transporter DctM subunit
LDEWIANSLLVVIVALLTVTVTLRYFFRAAYPGADELVGFAFVWFVYVSMVVAARRGRHFRVEFFVTLLSPSRRLLTRLVADAVWLVFNMVVVFQGLILIKTFRQFKNRSPMLGWSMEYIYLIIPVSFGLVSVYLFVDAVRLAVGATGDERRSL